MSTFDLSNTLSNLQNQRTQLNKELSALDKAIDALRGVGGASGAVSNHQPGVKRTLSVAARKKIAAAQRKRWAKVREAKKTKA